MALPCLESIYSPTFMSHFDLEQYRQMAEEFDAELTREYYLHFSGQKDDFAIEEIYGRFEGLFGQEQIERVRELLDSSSGDERKRLQYLLNFAVEGYLGQQTKSEAAKAAAKEASLTIEVDGSSIPFRQSTIEQSNEPDRDRREAIERARLEITASELNPLYSAALERAHKLSRDLGWRSYREMCEQLKGVGLSALENETRAFSNGTEGSYEAVVGPQLVHHLGFSFEKLRRSDLSYFFRAPQLDRHFTSEKLMTAFEETMAGLGIDIGSQENVTVDIERRPQKSPRAFCAPVNVPGEIYLVVPLSGGRDDYFALFHEGGHTEHYAHMGPALAFEFRHLGDTSVTEAFAFLFHHLVEDPHWLREKLGVGDPADLESYARACKLIYLRRYAAKLRYELELHAEGSDISQMGALYSDLLGGAMHTEWPAETYLSDVDAGFYVASYLRAWALEACLRRELKERFGERWFSEREAGDYLKGLWGQGSRYSADELVERLTGSELDFQVMLDEVS